MVGQQEEALQEVTEVLWGVTTSVCQLGVCMDQVATQLTSISPNLSSSPPVAAFAPSPAIPHSLSREP